MDAIEKLRAPLEHTNQEDRIIKRGLKNVEFSDYIASLDRTSAALQDLKRSNFRANQGAIADLSTLLKRGTKELEDAFREILRDCCRQKADPLEYVVKSMTLHADATCFPDTRQTTRFRSLRKTNCPPYASSTRIYPTRSRRYHKQMFEKHPRKGPTPILGGSSWPRR